MKRELPVYQIEGTAFVVDVDKKELGEVANPNNVLSVDDMKYNGSSYSFEYDLSVKNFPDIFKNDPQYIRTVEIPQLITLDPIGMSEKHNIPIAQLEGKSDFDIIVDRELFQWRMSGLLPKIDIAGHDFIIDIRLNELRPVDDFSTSIRLDDLYYADEVAKYQALYHVASHSVVDINPDTITELPKGVVFIELPNEKVLDPVGFARKYNLDHTDLLVKYPIQKNLEATVIPLAQTILPEYIARNKERDMKEKKREPLNELKKNKRKHKGHGRK